MSTETNERKGYAGWAIVSQMGHVTIAGYVTETTLAGHGILSVAIPDGDRTIEKLIPPATLYDLTWVGEDEARRMARKHPVQVIDDWTIRADVRERIEAEERERLASLHERRGECATCGQDIPAPDGEDGHEEAIRTYAGGGYDDRYGGDDEDDA